MNQFNVLHGDDPTEPPREWKSQPPEVNFKYRNSASKHSPMTSAIIGILNNHAVDNDDVELYPSGHPLVMYL